MEEGEQEGDGKAPVFLGRMTEGTKVADAFEFMSIDLLFLVRPERFAKLTLQDLSRTPFG